MSGLGLGSHEAFAQTSLRAAGGGGPPVHNSTETSQSCIERRGSMSSCGQLLHVLSLA